MNGNVKFGLTPGRCLILCALSALIGCALFLFSASGAEATLALGWFPFTQLQGLTADADGLTPPGVCLAFAALPAVGFLLLLIRRCFRAEDLLLLVCVGLLYHVMRGKLSLEGLMAGEAAVQPAEFWTALLAWAGLRILRACYEAQGAPLLRLGGWAVCAAALYFAYSAGANIGSAVFLLRPAASAGGVSCGAAAWSRLGLNFVSACLGVGACALTLHALRRFALDGGLTEAALGALRALARYCAGALMAMLLLSAALAVLNMLLARSGVGLGSVSFPVSALIFCFAALLGARFAAAHKRLRDENDMFI